MQGYTGDSAEKFQDRPVEEAAEDEDDAETHPRDTCMMLVGVFLLLLMTICRILVL